MNDIEKDLKSRYLILEAAKAVFLEKGFEGARMQEIADRAGINKALLHYYFSTKEKLFEEIFLEAFSQFVPSLQVEIDNFTDIRIFFKRIIAGYIEMLIQRPYLPIFILNELHRNPERPWRLLRESGINPTQLIGLLQKEIEEGRIRKMDPRELLLNIIALCVFPFAARPMTQRMLWKNDMQAYDMLLRSRINTVFDFVERSVFI